MSYLRRRFISWLRGSAPTASKRVTQKHQPQARRRKLHLEYLEDRLTPAVTFINLEAGTNNLLITDGGNGVSGSNNDNITIFSDNANSQWIINDPGTSFSSSVSGTGGNNSSSVTIPFSSVAGGQILVNTLDGIDTLTVNRSLGGFNKAIVYNGGNPTTIPGDKLVVTGGSQVNNANVGFVSKSSGTISFDSEVYQFSGLEPVDLSGVPVANYTVTLTTVADQAILEDDGALGNNVVQLRSLNGSFELTKFQNPSNSLTVLMSSGTDTFNVSTVAPANDFTAALTVDGNDNTDVINLNGPLNLGANNCSFTAETIDVSSSVTTTGNITANAGTAITGTAAGLLTGNLVTLTSGGGIGTQASPIRTQANSIIATTSGTGGIYVNELDSATLTNVSAFDGDIVIDAGASLDAGSITANGVGRNVRLRALAGNLTVSSVNAAGDVVNLFASGAIVDGNGGTNNVNAAGLSLRAGAGAGTAVDPLETTVSTMAANVTGDLYLQNTGALTIGTVNFLDSVTGITGLGSGAVDVTTFSPIIIAANVNSTGVITFTATEISDSPFFQDFITINPGIQVVSTGNNVILQAGDDVNLLAGSLVQSVTGSVTITAGLSDADGQGAINMDPTCSIQASTAITLSALQDLLLTTLLSVPGGSVNLNTNGAVLDGNGASLNVVAATLAIVSNTGVGIGGGGPIDTQLTSTLDIINNIGDVFVDNNGTLLVGFVLTFGNVTLQAFGGSLKSNTVDGNADIVAISGTVTANVTGAGSTVGNGTPLEIDADIFNATSAGGSINALDTAGALAIGLVNANGGNVTLGATGGDLTSEGSDPGVADVLGSAVTLYTFGSGSIGNGSPLEIDATTNLTATTPNGNINITDEAGGLPVGLVNAGAGNVILTAVNGALSAVAPNNGVAEVIGNNVNLNTTGTGTIGLPGPFFFEVNSNVLSASTVNQIIWISEVGSGASAGTAIGLINAGAAQARLRLANGGAFTSQTVDNVADIVANGIFLAAPNGGAFGTSFVSPLELDGATVQATIGAPSTGMWLRDTAGGISVPLATTVNAIITLQTLGGSLALTTVNAGTSNVRLDSAGAVTGTPGGTPDVTAANLRVNATAGITLETVVQNLAFGNTGGAVQISNTGPLTINSVLGQTTSSNIGTTTTVSAASPLTVAVNTTSAGTLTLTAGEIADFPTCADDLTVNSGVTVQSTGADVILQAGDDIILNTGSIVQAAGNVTLTAGFGDLDTCGGVLLNGIIISGNNIVISSINDVCIGALTAPNLVSVTSTAGAIIDCNDPPAGTLNITSNLLLLQAATGIGSPGVIGTIETNINFLEATTGTGGIYLSDIGSYDVGGVDPTVLGVRNTGATGDINLAAAGTIRILNFNEIVRAPGLVTITTGVDIFSSGGNPLTLGNPFEAAIASSNNSIILNAGQDVHIGLSNGDAIITNDYGDVRAANDLTINAGRDFIVDENSYVDAGAGFVSGNVVATAGRDIRVLQTNIRDSRIGTFGGTITLTTGPGGEFELNTGNNPVPGLYGIRTDLTSLSAAGGVGGNITINADDVEIVDVEDIVNAATARVTIRPVTAGRPIDIGTDGIGTNLGLTDYELDRIVAGVVVIGSAASGPISVTAAVNPAQFSTLHLITPSTIMETPAGALTIASLAAQGDNGVTMNGANAVGTLAGTSVGTPFSFTNTALLTIGTVDGVTGISSADGDITLTSPDLNITQPVNAAGGNVNLLATPATAVIGVGTNVGTLGVTYGISDAELALVLSTGVITIGDGANLGGMQVAGSENVGPASIAGKNIDLVTGQHITVVGSMTGAANFNLFAGKNINLTATGTLGADLLTLNFGQDGSGATATITGTLQSAIPVFISSGTGDDTLLFNFTSPTALPASGVIATDFGGNDLLDGPDFNQLFTLTGANTGTLAGVGGSYQGTIDYSGFENLAGGTADDRFLFLPAGSVDGNIDGVVGGVNKLDYTVYGSAVSVNLQTHSATAIGGTFANINTFCGYSAPGVCSDLIGPDLVTDWQITAIDSGTINAMMFMGFGNLFGGNTTDTFTFGAAGQLNCNIDGGAGSNTIVSNDVAHTFTISGADSGAIDSLFVGSVAPVLPGPIPCPISIVTPPAPPTRFTNIQNLTAGTGDDRFFFVTPGSLTGLIDGGAGNNTLYGDNGGRTFTVTGGGAGTVSVILPAGFTNVQNLIGGTGADTFIVNAIGAANMTIAGVQGADVFTVNNTGTATLTLCGGDDADAFTINNTGSGAVIATGDDAADTFTVNGLTGPVTLNGNNGNDVFTVNGTGAGLLTAGGDDGNDDFQVNNVGVGGAIFNGDAGNDRFALRANAGVVTFNGGADGEVANVGSNATVAALGVGNLDGITATLNLNMGTGATAINIGDQTAGVANSAVEVTNANITGFAPAVINYTASSGAGNSLALTLFGSNLGDTFNVRSTLVNPDNPTGDVTTIQGGTGNDRFNLGSAGNLLDGLLGLLNVQGNAGAGDQVCFFDQGQTIAYNYTIAATTFTRTGGLVTIPAITYAGMEMFKAEAGSGDDNFIIQAIGATTSADIRGNDGDDQFQITASTANALVASLTTTFYGGNGKDRFFVQSTEAATPGAVRMIGEAGDDQFTFPGAGILANGFIDGGDGIDTLDYSTYSTGALVNLRPTPISTTSPLTPGQQKPGTQTPGLPAGVLGMQNQTASGLFNGPLDLAGAAGRIAMATATNSTIENMVGSPFDDAFFGAEENNRFEGRLGNDYAFGGAGNDILIGNEGDDTLFGEDGDDVIYGAAGRDAMYGGLGFDILLIDDCNDVRPGLNTGDRVLDVGGLGPVDGGVIDIVVRVPPLTGDINDPRINWSNNPLIVFQQTLPLRPVAGAPVIQPINSAPVLDASYNAALTNVAKGATSPSGDTVANIVGSSVSDFDGLAQLGIAVTAAGNTNGQWQYSLNGGTTWINMGTVSTSAARLLRMSDLIRFVPKASFTGTATISYAAWDQTTGVAGGTASLAKTGGKTAFSTTVGSAAVSVKVVNHAPVLSASGTYVLPSLKANTTSPASVTVSALLGKNVTDADSGALKGIAITSVDNSKGTWQYSINAGKTWTALTTVGDSASLLLRSSDLLRFMPKTGTTGPSNFSFHAWDQTTGSAGTLANLLVGTGGSTAFSADQVFAKVQVGNTAPVLNTASPFTLNSSNTGTTVEALLGTSVTDPDLNAKRGIAVTSLAGATNGKWQYSTDGGKTWKNFGTIAAGSAQLLRAQDKIRFVPNANFHGQVSLQFQAWDQFEGVAGSLIKLAISSTSYSSASATANLTVA